MKRELKGKVAWVTRFQYVCLGLRCKVKKFDSNCPLLTVWDCLTLLPHSVTSGNYDDESCWMMKDNCFYHVCYWIDANVEWLIELELES